MRAILPMVEGLCLPRPFNLAAGPVIDAEVLGQVQEARPVVLPPASTGVGERDH